MEYKETNVLRQNQSIWNNAIEASLIALVILVPVAFSPRCITLFIPPKEAIMHAIYRQNYGFTDIIIGRKHADAPFDDGTPVWGDFDAQAKFDKLNGELLIKPVKVGFAAYFEEIGRVGLIKDYKDKGYLPEALINFSALLGWRPKHDKELFTLNELIKEFHDKLKVTSIVVTHDIESAYRVGDKIAMLHDGKIVYEGTPAQVENTDNHLVRGFVTGQLGTEASM